MRCSKRRLYNRHIVIIVTKGPFIATQLNSLDVELSWRLWSICRINRHVFFHYSINFFSNSSLQNSISRQTRQNTSYMTSWPTNWVNWVTTFRTDRWQLFTLWTCRQLDVELSWVEFRRYKRALRQTSCRVYTGLVQRPLLRPVHGNTHRTAQHRHSWRHDDVIRSWQRRLSRWNTTL